MWDMFGRPAKLPSRNTSFLRVWWYDDAAAKRLAGRGDEGAGESPRMREHVNAEHRAHLARRRWRSAVGLALAAARRRRRARHGLSAFGELKYRPISSTSSGSTRAPPRAGGSP